MIGATLLSEFVTPAAEIKSGEADLTFRGKTGSGRLKSGYWFKEPTANGGTRIINIATLMANGEVAGIVLYEFNKRLELSSWSTAQSGRFLHDKLVLRNISDIHIASDASAALANADMPPQPPAQVTQVHERELVTSLSPERLLARVLTPERMSLTTLLDYIEYLQRNHLQTERQVVAVWRKVVYPFTLLVMITIAAPIGFVQTRRGGVGVKVFIGILLGVGFFMINQLALNVGMLSRWPPWLTALGPNAGALLLALGALFLMEYRHFISRVARQGWPWRKIPA
eukprot:scaffold32.g3823.t1